MNSVLGFYIKLNLPFIDSHGLEYDWLVTKEDAKGFVEAYRSTQNGSKDSFRVVKYGNNYFDEVAHMEIDVIPHSNRDWVILSITHWPSSPTARFYHNENPNLFWEIKLRVAEFENIVSSLMFVYDL